MTSMPKDKHRSYILEQRGPGVLKYTRFDTLEQLKYYEYVVKNNNPEIRTTMSVR